MESNPPKSEAAFPFAEIVQASSIIFSHRELKENFPVMFMSSNVAEVLGSSGSEFESHEKLWFDRIHEADVEKVEASYRELDTTGHAVNEFRFRHVDGHYVWLREEIKLVTGEPGAPDTFVGSAIDITEQKKAEEKLQELNRTLEKRIGERTSKLATANRKLKKQIQYRNKAEAQLKKQHKTLKLQELAIDNLNDMVVVTKARKDNPLNSKVIFVNRAFERFTGYSSEEVVGCNPAFLHGEKTSQKVLDHIEQKIASHEPLREEFINYKKDGTPYWAELDMAPFPAEETEYEFWVGINRDITQRKLAEQKIEESEQRYRAFAELSFDAIFEIDLEGIIVNCNKRACELFGYSRPELIGMNTLELTPEKYRDAQPDIISNVATTGNEAWERTYKKKDGTLFPTEIHTQLFKIGGKKRLIAYVRDNSAHKEYERAIRKSLKEKEMLLAEVHHRVKNNLAIISGLLEMQVFNTEDQQLLGKLQESQSRIQSIAMVHEKLYSSESFSEIAIDQYINDLLAMIINSMGDSDKDIEVKREMKSIFLNVSQAIPCGLLLNELITNCYKHAFPDQKEGTINISLKESDGFVVLSVTDNGVGFPENFNIENESSLGMTLINTLVKQLGGELQVSSQQGSCFRITFELDKSA